MEQVTWAVATHTRWCVGHKAIASEFALVLRLSRRFFIHSYSFALQHSSLISSFRSHLGIPSCAEYRYRRQLLLQRRA